MEEEYLVPHFHGFTFRKEGLFLKEEQMEFYNALYHGEIDYYNQMVLKNAVVDYTALKYKWRKKLLEDFYLKDHQEIIETQIDDFYEFWQAYINTYKKDNKELYSEIQEKLKNTKYRDYWFLNPKLKEWIPLLQEYKKEKNKKKYSEIEKKEYQIAIEAIKKYKEEENYSPFVAMSKLPRHAVKFALAGLSEIEINNFGHFRDKDEIFLGAVIITLDEPQNHLNKTHYDVLQNATAGNIKVNCRFKNQAEVDFLKIEPFFVFPIFKPAVNKAWQPEFKTKYQINPADYENLKNAIRHAPNVEKIQDKLTDIYQNIILNYIKQIIEQHNFKLIYQTPNNEWRYFSDNILGMQNNMVEESKKIDPTIASPKIGQSRTKIPLEKEIENLHEQHEEVFEDLSNIVNSSPNTKEAITKLSSKEKEGIEAYETVCLDRIFLREFPHLSRAERDEKLAKCLDAMEGFRKETFVEKLKNRRKEERQNISAIQKK